MDCSFAVVHSKSLKDKMNVSTRSPGNKNLQFDLVSLIFEIVIKVPHYLENLYLDQAGKNVR